MTQLHPELDDLSIPFSSDLASDVPVQPGWGADGIKNTWNDVYTARQRVFESGQMEITICKEKYFIGPAIRKLPRAARGKSEKTEINEESAGRRAKKNVRLCCKEIGADRLVTLTYRENMTDRERALKHWKAFCRRLGRVKQFHYVAVIELQERGAIHFHVAVRGRQNYFLLRSIWQSVVGLGESGEQMAQVNVRDPHKFGFGKNGAHKLAAYLAKYVSKQMDCRELNEKRYFRSRGIVLPEVTTWRLSSTNMLSAVETAFAIAFRHGLEGIQTWCNNGLGVVWLATAPRRGPLMPDCPF